MIGYTLHFTQKNTRVKRHTELGAIAEGAVGVSEKGVGFCPGFRTVAVRVWGAIGCSLPHLPHLRHLRHLRILRHQRAEGPSPPAGRKNSRPAAAPNSADQDAMAHVAAQTAQRRYRLGCAAQTPPPPRPRRLWPPWTAWAAAESPAPSENLWMRTESARLPWHGCPSSYARGRRCCGCLWLTRQGLRELGWPCLPHVPHVPHVPP
jgi:hypothetical protein